MQEPVLTGLTLHQSIPLHPGYNQLGRNPTNDFRIPDATVSSFHCEVVVSHDQILVRDLNSTNGTFIDGKQIQEQELQGGQVLKIGSVEFRLEDRGIRVAIPEVKPPEKKPIVLPEGCFPCVTHPDTIAIWKCTECSKTWCGQCVRQIKRKGGQPLRLCKACRGQCEPLALPGAGKKKKESLLGRITQTIRIFKR